MMKQVLRAFGAQDDMLSLPFKKKKKGSRGSTMIAAVLLFSLLQSSPNTLTPAEKAAGWRLLFDGRTLAGCRGLRYDTLPPPHPVLVDGAIKKIASGNLPRVADGPPLVGGGRMTVDSFADFELSF